MAKTKTHEEFMEEFLTSDNSQKINILGKYVNFKTKISCECKICGRIWETKPASLFKITGCPSCVAKAKTRFVSKTHDKFVEELSKINYNIKIVGKYKTSNEHIKCQCKVCNHEWNGVPNNLLRGAQCPRCSRENMVYYNLKTTKQFIEEMKVVSPNIEILGEYIHSKEKIKCRCKKCDYIWETTPNSLLAKKSGCPNCAQNERIRKAKESGRKTPTAKSHNEFVEEMKSKNPNIEILGKYTTNKTKIKCRCKICDYVWSVRPNSLVCGQGCPLCGRKTIGEKLKLTNEEFQTRISKLNSTYTVLDKYENCKKKVECHCNICGGKWKASPIKLLNGCGCPICAGKDCVVGINDIATVRPDLVKYFINKEDATKYTVGSCQRIIFKCPDCGSEKEMTISVLTSNGFSCDICNDKLSYPNKYMRGFVSQIPVENVIYEYNPEWIKPSRYDGYFEYKGQAYIMEMDGELGHGKRVYGTNEKDIEGLERDRYKDYMANQHNIKVIRIDCIKSESDYISNNIINSELNDIFDLSVIDWNKCNEFATKNIVKEVCDYFNKTKFLVSQIAKDFKLGNNTVRRYLKRGTELGWCNYVPNGHRTKKVYIPKTDRKFNRGILVYNKNDVNTVLHTFQNSVECAENMSNIYECNFIPSCIRNVINGYNKTYKGFVFKYAS